MTARLFFSSFVLLVVALCQGRGENNALPAEKRTITSAQFCGGCRVTVELLGKLASQGINKMAKERVDPGVTLDVTKLSDGLCSRKEFQKYNSFVRDSCLKLMQDHKYHFLNVFAGQQSTLFSSIRGNMYRAKKEACTNESNACPSQLFNSEMYPVNQRTKCNACFEMGKDVEDLKFVLKKPTSNEMILEDLCQNLGSNHLPYSWIESHCESILDDHLDDIVHVLNQRDILKGNPHKSPFSKIVCSDIVGCTRDVKYGEL